jgi:uncharacterized protein YdcH (DUF465 family)
MNEKEEWTEVEAPSSKEETKVEFEVEEEEKVEAKPEAPSDTKVKEEPKELDGIETKGAQKRIRQLIKQRKDRDEHINKLIQQNEQLNTKLNTREEEFTNISKMHLDANEKQLTDKLELARAAYKSAHEEGDPTKLLQAQEFLNEAQTDIKSLSATKVELEHMNQPAPQQQQQQQLQNQAQTKVDPRAVEWSQNNGWFGQDRVMTAAALALDAELKEEGFSPDDPEFYNEIDNRIKEAFPTKFNSVVDKNSVQEQPSQPAQVVAGASRSTPTAGKVKLTKEDVRLAQNWGIPLEQYAAEKAKVQDADGEYTAIKL